MKSLYVVINGIKTPASEAVLGVEDLAIVRGYGIFDYFKTINHHPLFWDDNLIRFFQSANLMDLPVSYSKSELKEQIRELMSVNNIPNSGIKLLLTGGYSPDGYSIIEPNLIISQHALERDSERESQGIKLITYDYHRAFSHAKTIDYVMGIKALKKAHAAGADDVVYTQNGFLSECPRANIFFITKEGTLITSEKDVLQGITRKHILNMAKVKFKVECREVTLEDMKNASEAFITSTTKNITPVIAIDDIVYGAKPGAKTQQLQKMWEEITYQKFGD